MYDKTDNTLEVALRIRSLIDQEIERGSEHILEVYKSHNQVKIKNTEENFTFNYVFDCDTTQEEFYVKCIQPIVPNLCKDLNATVLAYGQSMTGKTHSMGTNYDGVGEMGIIPRAIEEIFKIIDEDKENKYTVTVSFVELHQDILYDLLAGKPQQECILDIQENAEGVSLPGLTQRTVNGSLVALSMLCKGSKYMYKNKESASCNAIFTINIFQGDPSNR